MGETRFMQKSAREQGRNIQHSSYALPTRGLLHLWIDKRYIADKSRKYLKLKIPVSWPSEK